jgi:hypothetical protein
LKMLSPLFPAALRAVDALAPIHARSPDGVRKVAALVEAMLQAYGRCLLATAGASPSEAREAGVAMREAEKHAGVRARLRAAVGELSVDADERDDAAIARCSREIDHLAHTVDTVLAALDVHCVQVASGLSP